MLNNPLRYIDPSGHDPVCGNSNSDPECESPSDDPVVINNPGPLDPGLPQGEPEDEDPEIIYQTTNNGLTVILMPEGYPPNPGANEYDDNWGRIWAIVGLAIEGGELGSYFLGNPAIPIVLGIMDAGATAVSCNYFHECYIGSPHPDLPEMLVMNQDFLLTSTEAVLPIAAGFVGGAATGGAGAIPAAAGTDIVTSLVSFGYDIGRLTGQIPNGVSVGVNLENGNVYVLLFP